MARILRTALARHRGALAVVAAALALWLAVTVPLALGERTFFFRDVFSNHLPLKVLGAQELARGEVPAFVPELGMGQPFRGNPSALAFYPGNLLYLALPFWSAFNLHFALHWLLAFLAMGVLARELGQGTPPALLAGLTYAGSGYLLSCLTFYNLVTVAAWWPLAMAGAVRGGRRGVALGGVACGLALLGGEPVTATLGLLPLVVAAVGRHRAKGLAYAIGVGAVGLLVAAPQVVATARILGFSFRAYHGASSWQTVLFSLSPNRYLELVLPLPFGWPLDLGPAGWWAWQTAPNLAFFFSLYAGIVGLWLAAIALTRRPVWAVVAIGGLALAWLWGGAADALLTVTGGLFRFPEKFLFWWALTVPLLAGWGLEAAGERPRRWLIAGWVGAGSMLLAALAVVMARPTLLAAFAGQRAEGPGPLAELIDLQSWRWIGYLTLGGALLAAAAWAASRRRLTLVVALQLVALVQLFPLVRTTRVERFAAATPWVRLVGPGAAVFHSLKPRPEWERPPAYRLPPGSRDQVNSQAALDLEAVPGIFHGLTYPLWPDAEGLSSPLYTFLTGELVLAPWNARATWLRAVGMDFVVFHQQRAIAGLELVARRERFGGESFLYRIRESAPDAWRPLAVEPAPGPRAAFARVAQLADPVATVVVAEAVEHRPGGRVAIVAEGADRVELDVAGPGGLVVLRRSYHPLYRVRAGGRRLDTQPVNVTLLGIEVPPGTHRVVVDVDDTPEALAGGFAILTVVAALAAGLWRRRGSQGAVVAAGAAPAVPSAGRASSA